MAQRIGSTHDVRNVRLPPKGLEGFLGVPAEAKGIILFAHGSGSGRHSPRNNAVAHELRQAGYATLLFDLLTEAEALDRGNVFDIGLLASRLVEAGRWVRDSDLTAHLPIGYYGASTGAAAALVASTLPSADVAAIVSRGGRPDLAGDALLMVRVPTLLIVGSQDPQVLKLNQMALALLRRDKELRLIHGAGHLFEEPGTMDQVTELARQWFDRFLPQAEVPGGMVTGTGVAAGPASRPPPR